MDDLQTLIAAVARTEGEVKVAAVEATAASERRHAAMDAADEARAALDRAVNDMVQAASTSA